MTILLWELAALALCAVAAVGLLFTLEARRRGRSWAAQRAVDEHVGYVDQMTPLEVEQLVARLLAYDGCTDVHVAGGTGDQGADVTASSPSGLRIVVQVKHWRGKVGSPHLHQFNGTAWTIHRADVALFVTTSSFTRAATTFAEGHSIELVDRAGLAAWMAGTAAAA